MSYQQEHMNEVRALRKKNREELEEIMKIKTYYDKELKANVKVYKAGYASHVGIDNLLNSIS